MEKTVFSENYRVVVELVREIRRESGLTQVEIAEKLNETQSFVSKYERGERRLDILELRSVAMASGITLTDFVTRLEKRLRKSRRKRSASK